MSQQSNNSGLGMMVEILEERRMMSAAAFGAAAIRLDNANVAKLETGPKGAVLSFREDRFANPEGLIGYIREQGANARLRPDMKLVLFADWETPEQRLAGATRILRRLVTLAEQARAA